VLTALFALYHMQIVIPVPGAEAVPNISPRFRPLPRLILNDLLVPERAAAFGLLKNTA
jgi:hypothetical protein